MATNNQTSSMNPDAFATQVEKELNTITWTQIPAVDLDRVQKFYKTIFGWAFTPMVNESRCGDGSDDSDAHDQNKPNEPLFIMFRFSESDCVPHGGFVKLQPENHLSPALHPDNKNKRKVSVNSTITVKSCDETLKRIVDAGGEVYMDKMIIPGGMGAVAFFLDTEKNVMGLWSEK